MAKRLIKEDNGRINFIFPSEEVQVFNGTHESFGESGWMGNKMNFLANELAALLKAG